MTALGDAFRDIRRLKASTDAIDSQLIELEKLTKLFLSTRSRRADDEGST